MNTEHYKAQSEHTDANERALIPPFKRKTIEQIDNDIARRKQRLTDTHKPMNTDTQTDTRTDQTLPTGYGKDSKGKIKTETVWANRLASSLRERDTARSHADKLAEALANLVRPLEHGWKVSDMDVRITEAQAELAAYEAAQ